MGPLQMPMDAARPVDVFVQFQPSDSATTLVGCIAAVQLYLRPCGGRITVVSATLPAEMHDKLRALDCRFLNEKEIFGFDAAAISGSPEARQRLFSQFVKWELRRFSQTQTYLVIEASRILNRPTDLQAGNRQTLFCDNRFRFGYLMCFNYFFGQIPYPASPAISEIQQFDCAVVDEMTAKIQAKYNLPWAHATFEILRQVRGTAFDAGQNYGHYLHLFRPESFAITRIGGKGAQKTREPASGTDVVRMSTLGYNGRFANQVFQFAYLRAYADRTGQKAECPPWIGCSLFGHQTDVSEHELPIYREDKGDTAALIRFDPQLHYRNIELWGYFQDSGHWTQNKQSFRDLFQPLPFLKNPLDEAVQRLRAGDRTLVAIHLRRGDFDGGPVFWPAPESWYLQWLTKLWPTLSNPILYIATDDPQNVLPHFAAYSPRTAADLNINVNGAEFYPDFYVLSQANVIGISNSTFSFAAAMMNQIAAVFARPDPVLEKMVAFDPWNSPVQLRKALPAPKAAAA